MKRFVTLYPETCDVHLRKEVGMTYTMGAHFGYDAELVCYDHGPYPTLQRLGTSLRLSFLRKWTGISLIDGALYLLRNGRAIDVLQVFHLRRSLIWILIYKWVNPRGRAYLRLDTGLDMQRARRHPERSCLALPNLYYRLLMALLRRCDLVSAETRRVCTVLNDLWTVPVVQIPNGYYELESVSGPAPAPKTKTILNVGRIGTKQKATEVLLEGFALAADRLPGWRLRVVGPIEPGFQVYLQDFFSKHSDLQARIDMVGEIRDPLRLNAEYAAARVFCSTSRFESFGFVFLEALRHGCFIVTTDVESAEEFTDQQRLGIVLPIDDRAALGSALVAACSDEERLEETFARARQFVREHYRWVDICRRVDGLLNIAAGSA